jgi:hypothetical protein
MQIKTQVRVSGKEEEEKSQSYVVKDKTVPESNTLNKPEGGRVRHKSSSVCASTSCFLSPPSHTASTTYSYTSLFPSLRVLESYKSPNPNTLKKHKKHIEFQIAAEQQQQQQQQLLDVVSHSSSTVVREYLVPQQEKKQKVVAPHVRIPQKSICFFFTNGAIILRDLPSSYSDFLQLATAAAATATASRYTQQSISFLFPYNPHQGLARSSSFAIKAWHG